METAMTQNSQDTETVVDLLTEDRREGNALVEKANSTTDYHRLGDLAEQIIAGTVRNSVRGHLTGRQV